MMFVPAAQGEAFYEPHLESRRRLQRDSCFPLALRLEINRGNQKYAHTTAARWFFITGRGGAITRCTPRDSPSSAFARRFEPKTLLRLACAAINCCHAEVGAALDGYDEKSSFMDACFLGPSHGETLHHGY